MAQWLYDRRDPFSWWFALASGLSVLWLAYSWPPQTQRMIEQEWLAQLETETPSAPAARPLPPAVAKPIAPPAQARVLQPPSPAAIAPAPETTVNAPTANHAAATTAATAPASPAQTAPLAAPDTTKAVRAARSDSYESMLLSHLERIKRYPSNREARLSKPQGVVRLWLVIARHGELLEAGLVSSSGSNLLDNEALRTVRSTRFPSFPEEAFEGASQHRFTVNLKYEIEG